MYSMNSVNTLSYTNTTWAMWQQYHNQYLPPMANYQGLNFNSFINHRPQKNEWSIQFSNVYHNFPIYTIHQLFGFYGKINSVIQLNGSDRTVYVNYDSEINAKRCVMAMMQLGYINLRVFPKNQSINPMGNSQSSMNNDKNLNLGIFSSVKNDVMNFNSGNSTPSNFSFMSNFSSGNTSDKTPVTTNLSHKSSADTADFFDKFKVNGFSESNGNSEVVKDDFISSRFQGNGSGKTTGKSEKSMMISSDSGVVKPQMIIEAQEVVVANIPEAFGVFYVLHLLEKFEPICCSEIKTVEKNFIRYCHVYFKTSGDAEAAETDFDNVELAGRYLIVMRPHKLAEEAENCGVEK